MSRCLFIAYEGVSLMLVVCGLLVTGTSVAFPS
jgi:hypothetical protein